MRFIGERKGTEVSANVDRVFKGLYLVRAPWGWCFRRMTEVQSILAKVKSLFELCFG